MKKTLIIITIATFLFIQGPQVFSQNLNVAPTNPEFKSFIDNIERYEITDIEGYYLGVVPSPIPPEINKPAEPKRFPTKYDLRELNLVTPIRNQGQCGSCWAFSTYGSLESWMLNFFLSEEDYSENNLKHAHGFDLGPCDGGNLDMSAAYLSRHSGPISEADDPYFDNSTTYCTDCIPLSYIDSVIFLPVRSSVYDNDYIKQAVLDYGALDVYMYWDPIYYDSLTYTYYYSGYVSNINHAVNIVGWDDEKIVPYAPGPGAFIIRNSWGTNWGENGYFYISYHDQRLAFNHLGYIDEKDDTTFPFETVYYYDELGMTTSIGYSGYDTAWGANWFISETTGPLTGVGFYAAASPTHYDLYIYDNFNGSSFSGLLHSQSGSVTYRGWHTVKLDAGVNLNSGDGFGVVIRFNTPSYGYPVPAEYPFSGYSSNATANPGESYISFDGSTWDDMTIHFYNTNICIKAFQNEGQLAPPVVDDITFDGCISELCTSQVSITASDPEGGNLTYTYNTPDGGSIIGEGANVEFDPPDTGPHPCPYYVEVTVTSDVSGLSASQSIPIYVKLAGDVNADGKVNTFDLIPVKNYFGQSGEPGWIDADVNCDGKINTFDLIPVKNQFGQSGCACP